MNIKHQMIRFTTATPAAGYELHIEACQFLSPTCCSLLFANKISIYIIIYKDTIQKKREIKGSRMHHHKGMIQRKHHRALWRFGKRPSTKLRYLDLIIYQMMLVMWKRHYHMRHLPAISPPAQLITWYNMIRNDI